MERKEGRVAGGRRRDADAGADGKLARYVARKMAATDGVRQVRYQWSIPLNQMLEVKVCVLRSTHLLA